MQRLLWCRSSGRFSDWLIESVEPFQSKPVPINRFIRRMRRNLYIWVVVIEMILLHGARAQQSAMTEEAEQAMRRACNEGNSQAIQSAAMQLASGGTYGADRLEYASNLLSSVEVNGVLFTGSKADTYPVLMLQYLKSMRTDVRVICLEWLSDAVYFQRIQASVGIEKKGAESIQLLAQKMPVYVSLAVSAEVIGALESDLYCTGLALKYSSVPLANVRGLYAEWWKACGKKSMASGYSLNANYLLPLAILARYAEAIGNVSDAKTIKQQYAEIAKSVGEKEQLPALK